MSLLLAPQHPSVALQSALCSPPQRTALRQARRGRRHRRRGPDGFNYARDSAGVRSGGVSVRACALGEALEDSATSSSAAAAAAVENDSELRECLEAIFRSDTPDTAELARYDGFSGDSGGRAALLAPCDADEMRADEADAGMPLLEDNVRERRFEVHPNFAGWRLDQFLSFRVGRMSRTLAQKVIKYSDLTIEPATRNKAKPSTRLHAGEVVVLREHLGAERVQDAEVRVLYKDSAVIILNKPAGMLAHQSTKVRLNTVEMYLRRNGFPDALTAHRLDRETSGIGPIRRMFNDRGAIEKTYRALVLDPNVRWPLGHFETITIPLGPNRNPYAVPRTTRGSLEAVTHVNVVGRRHHPTTGWLADLEVRIETGRTHQIRAHLSLSGTPVAGDKLYTHDDDAFFSAVSKDPRNPVYLEKLGGFRRHALHAWRVRMRHPVEGWEIKAEAPLPDLWEE
eukprot:jgi/Chlat1/6272/Chrsp44S05777